MKINPDQCRTTQVMGEITVLCDEKVFSNITDEEFDWLKQEYVEKGWIHCWGHGVQTNPRYFNPPRFNICFRKPVNYYVRNERANPMNAGTLISQLNGPKILNDNGLTNTILIEVEGKYYEVTGMRCGISIPSNYTVVETQLAILDANGNRPTREQ